MQDNQPRKATGGEIVQSVVRPRPKPRERNYILGFALASVAAIMLVAVVTLAMFLHYAEAHHAIAGL